MTKVNSNNIWVELERASLTPILAIRSLPPGKVGIGMRETQPKNTNVQPAQVSGWTKTVPRSMALSPSKPRPKYCAKRGNSIRNGEDTKSIEEGERQMPHSTKIIPVEMSINGTEIADQPKAALFGQNRASIRGIETTPSKPKGHHVAGNAKIGNRCGTLIP